MLLHCAFGCLRRHSACASCNCAFHGSGVTPTLGLLKPRTILPNLTSSSSDIRPRRSRSLCNLDFAGFKSNGHLPVFRQRLGTQLYLTTGLRRASLVSEHFEIFNFQNASSIAVARGGEGVIPRGPIFQATFLREMD